MRNKNISRNNILLPWEEGQTEGEALMQRRDTRQLPYESIFFLLVTPNTDAL